MDRRSFPAHIFVISFLLLSSLLNSFARASSLLPSHDLARRVYDTKEIYVDPAQHDVQFFNFVTRPDIDAPRWKIKVHNAQAVSPGYWFVSPYGIVEQTDNKKAYVGPHIYDNDGELVWSGAPLLEGYGAYDFRVSKVGDKDMLTAIVPFRNGSVIVDDSYEMRQLVDTGINHETLNMHGFHTVDNGTHGIYLNKVFGDAPKSEIMRANVTGKCDIEYTGFTERDLKTGDIVFEWDPEGHVSLDESTMSYPGKYNVCDDHPWDFMHANSVEKLPDGDYLLSGRRTYALYKISHKDGSILWRLGGKKSDFNFYGHFSGQHDARCSFQNETHMVISIMDNASGPGQPYQTNPFSRGLMISLRTDLMTAEVLTHFDHPNKGYAPARGNLQTLPNGNAFLCWTERALQSEHLPNGELIMEAYIPSGLKSYRSYKFPWVGRPQNPPDVHSVAIGADNGTRTVVHVSWNGATEVSRWNLHKTTRDGQYKQKIASKEKFGFETAFTYQGFASFVVVEAVDRDGKILGETTVFETIEPAEKANIDYAKELQWIQDHSEPFNDFEANLKKPDTLTLGEALHNTFSNPIVTFLCGIVFCVGVGLGFSAMRGQRDGTVSMLKGRGYEVLLKGDEEMDSHEWHKKGVLSYQDSIGTDDSST